MLFGRFVSREAYDASEANGKHWFECWQKASVGVLDLQEEVRQLERKLEALEESRNTWHRLYVDQVKRIWKRNRTIREQRREITLLKGKLTIQGRYGR